MKKQDFILIFALLAVAVVAFFVINNVISKDGAKVQVLVDGEIFYEYNLDENGEYSIETDMGVNTLVIKDKKAYVSEADCPDKLCVKQGEISKSGQSVICLPHKLVVTIVDDEGETPELDAIVGQ
ncbi:MAG: NusG domain II-containing protein [Lachnospiraceae bacterium]|nr:NusG domain II-containing protein [Lachnospiraceae bacterium]